MSMPYIQVFLSYHTDDKEKAIILKNELGNVGIDCFLAPDDIPAGVKFREILFNEIESRGVFIALISQSYNKSPYSDQELGIALGLKKIVIPFCIDSTLPYGFLDGTQCICSNNVEIDTKISELTDSILKLIDSEKDRVDLCIHHLDKSSDWNDASHWAKKIENISQFTYEQLISIIAAFFKNDQVRTSFVAKRVLKIIFKNNTLVLSSDTKSRLDDILQS